MSMTNPQVNQLNQLEQIKEFTTIVADTSDLETIGEFKPQDDDDEPEPRLRRDAER